MSFVRRYEKCATMSRTLLCCALLFSSPLVSCSGGGGSSGVPAGPLLEWPRLRRNDSNTGGANGQVARNAGAASLLFDFSEVGVNPTISTPTIGANGALYVGTDDGLISLDLDAVEDMEGNLQRLRWTLEDCRLDMSEDDPLGVPPVTAPRIGPIRSSISVNANGRDLVFGSDPTPDNPMGHVFRFRESTTMDEEPQCIFAFPTGSSAAPLILQSSRDLDLLSTIFGTTQGTMIALAESGLRRWSFPGDGTFEGNLSSSPALLADLTIAFATPEGLVFNLDRAGQLRFSTPIGEPFGDVDLLPSPAVGPRNDLFLTNAAGEVVAILANGSRPWTFTPEAPIRGSLIVAPLVSDGGGILGQSVVYAVDIEGTLYGIGTDDGELIRFCSDVDQACVPSTCDNEAPCDEVMRCSATQECTGDGDCPDGETCGAAQLCSATQACTADEDCPTGETCGGTQRCSLSQEMTCDDDTPCPLGETCGQFFCSDDSTEACGPDTCTIGDSDDESACTREARIPLDSTGPAAVITSPALSADSFVVAATLDGKVCARRLDGSRPTGTCQTSEGTDTGTACTPDDCEADGPCCSVVDAEGPCTEVGFCSGDSARACTIDTCADTEQCVSRWDTGCIALGDDVGTTTLSSPIIDLSDNIFVTTEKGLAIVQ